VLDCCAAPGGKTLQLANAVGPTGEVFAVDRHPGRMRRLTANVQRCGAEQVRLVLADMTEAPPFDGSFERILVDAPCSGTGTLRRHPEIRWRLTPEAIKLVSLRQGELLDRAADLLAAGGRLVYSVCSMEPEEGQGVIASFLERNPQMSVLDPAPELPAATASLVGADGFVRTNPAAHGLDGFFAAVLTNG
jgi:16S rRNA (cytosine967-C5)-methyltransferase